MSYVMMVYVLDRFESSVRARRIFNKSVTTISLIFTGICLGDFRQHPQEVVRQVQAETTAYLIQLMLFLLLPSSGAFHVTHLLRLGRKLDYCLWRALTTFLTALIGDQSTRPQTLILSSVCH